MSLSTSHECMFLFDILLRLCLPREVLLVSYTKSSLVFVPKPVSFNVSCLFNDLFNLLYYFN